MTARHKTPLLTGATLALAAGTIAVAIAGTAMAADLSVRPYMQSSSQSNDNPASSTPKLSIKPARKRDGPAAETTSSISWPEGARASLTPATAAISYAHAARATFAKARAAMELGVLLLDGAPKKNLSTLETATATLVLELEALERLPQNQSNTAVKKAKVLVQDWYETGLRIIKPPAQGVHDLPFPVTVQAKADAVDRALNQLIEDADAPKLSRRQSR